IEPEIELLAEDFAEDAGLGAGLTGEPAPNEAAGPVMAELIATRAELKRVQRERSETYNRAVAELVAKLLPVLDNLRRAVDTEASVEASESDEFRHFLSGVDLIYKQLNGVLEALGVKPITSVGEKFNPH